MKKTVIFSAAAVAAVLVAQAAEARDRIQIVGSSTVFPYTQAVAEEFANKTGMQAPVVESTGTGGGMKIFCQGIVPEVERNRRKPPRHEDSGLRPAPDVGYPRCFRRTGYGRRL